MEQIKVLIDFYSAIQNDNRIGATHISLYLALYYFYMLNQFQNPVFIKRTSVMYGAKICGLATYHKCIRDLNDFGYILYKPSYNPGVGSRVYLVRLELGKGVVFMFDLGINILESSYKEKLEIFDEKIPLYEYLIKFPE